MIKVEMSYPYRAIVTICKVFLVPKRYRPFQTSIVESIDWITVVRVTSVSCLCINHVPTKTSLNNNRTIELWQRPYLSRQFVVIVYILQDIGCSITRRS